MAEEESRQLFGRRRAENVPGGRPVRHVVKVSVEEEAALLGAAARLRVSVPRLLVDAALTVEGDMSLTERRQLAVEIMEVRRLLATVANNANQLAKFVNTEHFIPEWAESVLADYWALRPIMSDTIERLVK